MNTRPSHAAQGRQTTPWTSIPDVEAIFRREELARTVAELRARRAQVETLTAMRTDEPRLVALAMEREIAALGKELSMPVLSRACAAPDAGPGPTFGSPSLQRAPVLLPANAGASCSRTRRRPSRIFGSCVPRRCRVRRCCSPQRTRTWRGCGSWPGRGRWSARRRRGDASNATGMASAGWTGAAHRGSAWARHGYHEHRLCLQGTDRDAPPSERRGRANGGVGFGAPADGHRGTGGSHGSNGASDPGCVLAGV